MFQVDFYNYGKGSYEANVTFTQHPPTPGEAHVSSGSVTPPIGEDPPGGGTDVDAQETYQLDFTGSPHPRQGYHVKLTVNAPRSQGADTKHKVFWVKPCASEENPPGGGGDNPPGDNPAGDNPAGDNPAGDNPAGDNPPGDIPPGGNGQPPAPGGNTTPIPIVPGSPSGTPVTSPSQSTASGQQTRSSAAAGSAASQSAGAQVPTSVDAGLAGETQADPSGSLATSLLGLCGLLTAAGWVAAYRRRGARQP